MFKVVAFLFSHSQFRLIVSRVAVLVALNCWLNKRASNGVCVCMCGKMYELILFRKRHQTHQHHHHHRTRQSAAKCFLFLSLWIFTQSVRDRRKKLRKLWKTFTSLVVLPPSHN